MASDGQQCIITHQLFDGDAMRGPAQVFHAGGTITAIVEGHEGEGQHGCGDCIRLPPKTILAPGLIDVQVNGGGGALLNAEPSCQTIRTLAQAHRRFGTTGLLPTLITDAPEKMQVLAQNAAAAMHIPGVLGFHLEGPCLNIQRKGIHPAAHIRTLLKDDLETILAFARAGRSMVTLAPEIAGADLIRTLAHHGLRICIGHSDATAQEVQEAVDAGATGVTHLFNAMSQMLPRAPGLVGAALDEQRLYAGLICDGLHVDAMNMRVAFKAKGRDRLMLVTDAMPTAASDIRAFELSGRTIVLHEGRLTGPDGTLAGAHLTMIGAVQNAVAFMGVSLLDALIMASRTPAHFLGLEHSHGRIKPGFQADYVAFNDEFLVTDTWIGGDHQRH